MGQLVDHHVVDLAQGGLDEPPVEADLPPGVAAPPAGAGAGEAEAGRGQPHAGGEVGHPLGEEGLGLAPVPALHRAADGLGVAGVGEVEVQGLALQPYPGAAGVPRQMERQIPAQVEQARAVRPWEGRVDGAGCQLLPHPFGVVTQQCFHFTQAGPRGGEDGEAVVVHAQGEGAATGAALEGVGLVCPVQADGAGLGGGACRHQRTGGRVAISPSIQASTC